MAGGYVLYCNGGDTTVTGDGVSCTKTVGSYSGDVYGTLKCASSTHGFVEFDSHSSAAYWIQFTNGGRSLAGVQRCAGAWFDHIALAPTNPSVAYDPPPLTWFILEVYFKQNVLRQVGPLHCGTPEVSGAFDLPMLQVRVGQVANLDTLHDSTSNFGSEVWIDHVKVGTTRWGNDIFEDDFSSGDFSAWDTHPGAAIITDPGFPLVDATCDAFNEIVKGVYLAPITVPYGNVPVGQLG